MIKINRSLAVLFLAVSISTLINMGLSQKTYAASKTWSGAVCAKTVDINDADCMWDNPLNWLGGVVPANGDSLTFTHILSDGHFGPRNNMPGLTINSINFTDFDSSVDKAMFVFSPQTITITNGIYNTFDTKGDLPTFSGGAITLGGDMTITGVSIGRPVLDHINLSGHSLSFVDTGTMVMRQIWSAIDGDGIINFNSDGIYNVGGANTYTGTTNIIKGGVANGSPIYEMFGTSDINISDIGEVTYIFNSSDRTISNKITINGKADKNTITSLSFLDSAGTTISLPNITLNGNVRFLNKMYNPLTLTVDLAGIKSNGYCVWYTGGGDSGIDGPSNGFINGPTMCKEVVSPITSDSEVLAETAAPTAPNTAIQKFILANPVIVAALGITTAAAIFMAARRQLGKK